MARVARADRLVAVAVTLSTLLGVPFAVVVVPGALSGSTPVMVLGLLAQLAATALVATTKARPHLGLAAVLLVAALLRLADSPWQPMVVAGAVPWLPFAVAWATVLAVGQARTPGQSRLALLTAIGYLVALAAGTRSGTPLSTVLGASVPLLGGLCVSLAARLRQARRDRAVALAYRTRTDERQRVAAEVHDTLGHVLTLLVLHANALGTADDPRTRETGARMSELGGQGLTELRRILTLLDPPTPAPAAGHHVAESVGELVEQARTAGQAVALTIAAPLPALPPTTANALVRTVQEGLTNARVHAPGAAVAVEVSTEDDTVRAAVRNERGGPPTATGSGRGLAALSKRIDLLGGRCHHAETDDGGYALAVEIPVG